MLVDTKNLISILEANENFARVTDLVDENGSAIILKDNKPKYVVIEFSDIEKKLKIDEFKEIIVDEEEALLKSSEIISRNIEAFKELAK